MGWTIRLLLTVLLALMLPLQGLASSTGLFCEPAHHGAGTVTQAAPTGEHAGHEPHAEAPDELDAQAVGCSACSACCASPAMLPPVAAVAPAMPTPRLDGMASFAAHDGTDPDGLERPPRHRLA